MPARVGTVLTNHSFVGHGFPDDIAVALAANQTNHARSRKVRNLAGEQSEPA